MADPLQIYASTHVGRVRLSNEDRCRTPGWRATGANEDWSGTVARPGGWVVIADGMGGHGAGEIASDIAVQSLAGLLSSARSPTQIAGAIQTANHAVHDAMSMPGGRPAMGTTVVGVRLGTDTCTFFNVGDSRAYVMRGRELRMLSVDHTPTAGRAIGARSHALTQSLGGTLSRRVLTPHIENVAILPGDTVLLCSDGLTDLIDDDGIAIILRKVSRHPAAALVDAALDAGGRDNVTVAVVAF